MQQQDGRLDLVPRRVPVVVLVKELERRLGRLEVGEEADNVFNLDVGFPGGAERVKQAAGERLGLVGRRERGRDLVGG